MTLRKRPNSTVAQQLQEVMELHGTGQSDLASLWGLSRSYICDLVNGRKGISTTVALRLEATFGLPTALEWLTLQAKEDLADMRKSMADELNHIANIALGWDEQH